MNIIQKGYGELKLVEGDVFQGEITLYAEGWVGIVKVPPSEDGEPRWFPTERVAEVIWRKSIAVRRQK